MSRGEHRVELAPAAQRQLRRLPPGDAARLRGPILALALVPRPAGVMKLAGTDFWRVRVGDHRIVFMVDDAARLVVVLKVARRSESTHRRAVFLAEVREAEAEYQAGESPHFDDVEQLLDELRS